MVLAALTILAVGAFIGGRWYYRRAKLRAGLAKLEDNHMPELFRAFGPLIRMLAGYNKLVPLPGIRERYLRQVERAGLTFELSGDEFLAIKELAVLFMLVVAIMIYVSMVQNVMIVVAFGFIGLVYPDLSLSAAVKKQQHACLRALPGFLDLLALSVEAGMGFDSAVRKLTEVLEPSPLIWRFQAYLRSMNVGKPRTVALREMAEKLDLPDFTSFAKTVAQATETGASMGPVLKSEAAEMLFHRFERAEKSAHELPVKILLPLFVFVFPATFLMVLGPMYFQFISSGAAGAL
jgi:tight adherence protein C